MSGGSYDYAFEKVSALGDDILGRSRGNKRREMFAAALEAASVAAKAIEWVDSGDCSSPDDDVALMQFFAEMQALCNRERELREFEIIELERLTKLQKLKVK